MKLKKLSSVNFQIMKKSSMKNIYGGGYYIVHTTNPTPITPDYWYEWVEDAQGAVGTQPISGGRQ